jgi:protein involved in sex pheromone biosynthesis
MVMKKVILIACIASLVFLLASCVREVENQMTEASSKEQTDAKNAGGIISIQDIKNPRVYEEGKYYEILEGDGNLYYYYIFDDNNKT